MGFALDFVDRDEPLAVAQDSVGRRVQRLSGGDATEVEQRARSGPLLCHEAGDGRGSGLGRPEEEDARPLGERFGHALDQVGAGDERGGVRNRPEPPADPGLICRMAR